MAHRIKPFTLFAVLVMAATPALTNAAAPPTWAAGEYHGLLRQRNRLVNRIQARARAGELAGAISLFPALLDLERKLFGPHHIEVAGSLTTLASLHEQLDAVVDAVRVRSEALVVWQAALPASHWRTIDARLALATARRLEKLTPAQRRRLRQASADNLAVNRLLSEGKQEAALAAGEKVLAVRQDLLGERHRDTAITLANLALIHEEMGDHARAKKLADKALAIRRELMGEEHPQVANSLHNIAGLLKTQGEMRKALEMQERAHGIIERAEGKDHLHCGVSALNLARLLQSAGDSARARQLFERARAVLQVRLGATHPAPISCLISLGTLLLELAELDQAERYTLEAIGLLDKGVGKRHFMYVSCLENLARVSRERGQLDRALRLAQEALDAADDILGRRSLRYAEILGLLGGLHMDRGDFARARQTFDRAEQLLRKIVGGKHASLAEVRFRRARLEMQAGRYGDAYALFEETNRWARENLGEKHPNYLTGLGYLAALDRERGMLVRARVATERHLELEKKQVGLRHPRTIQVLGGLARLHRYLGDRERAWELMEQTRDLARDVLGKQDPTYAIALGELAALSEEAGQFTKAAELASEAALVMRKRLGPRHPKYATALSELANIHFAMGQHERALRECEQIRLLERESLGEKHSAYAMTLVNMGAIYFELAEPRKALPLAEEGWRLLRESLGERHPDASDALLKLASVLSALGQLERGEKLARQGLGELHEHAETTLAALGEQQQIGFLEGYRRQLSRYLVVSRLAGTSTETVYDQVLQWKGTATRHLVERRLARDRPELSDLVNRLQEARAALAGLASRPPGSKGRQEWQKRFRQLADDKERLEVELATKNTSYRKKRQMRSADVRRALPPGAVLVDLVEYPVRQAAGKGPRQAAQRLLVAFIITRDRPVARIELGKVSAIDAAIAQWRKPLQATPPGAIDSAAGDSLRKLVWQPLAKHLAGCDTVLVAPEGSLCGMPLAALPGSKPGRFLIEEVALAQVSSIDGLLDLVSEEKADGLLAVGGLAYGAKDGKVQDTWMALPGTRLEADRIVRLYRGRFARSRAPLLLAGKGADRERLLRELRPGKETVRWRYLHLATHGYFSPEQAGTAFQRHPFLASGLALAGANSAPTKGLLTAEEVAALDMRGCELVVLSACETGLGRLAAGEGVIGLQRAFHLAGARATVASLWSVSDPATSVLMEQFYTRLWGEKKMSKLEALRQAQLFVLNNPRVVLARGEELRKEVGMAVALRGLGRTAVLLPAGSKTDSRRSHPAWWAAFVMSGDCR